MIFVLNLIGKRYNNVNVVQETQFKKNGVSKMLKCFFVPTYLITKRENIQSL